MDATLLLFLLLLPVLMAVIAFCSASETAFFSLTRTDRLRLRRLSAGAGAATNRLLTRPRTVVLAVLLVTNAGNVTFFLIVSVLERRISHGAVGLLFNVAILLAMIVLGDLLPKLLAASHPVHFARALAKPLEVQVRLVGPLTKFLEFWLVGPILRLIRPGKAQESESVTVEELGTLLDLSARSGDIAEDEQRILADVVRLGSTRVRDVMVPRIAMPWVADRFTPADVVRVLRKTPTDRIPVFRGSPDGKPLGLLNVQRYLPTVETSPESKPGAARDGGASSLEPLVFIPERARMDQLLDLLRMKASEQALCVDEYGAVVGMITIHEVLRELVAAGATEGAGAAGAIERRSTTCWIVPGRLPARELAGQLGAREPSSLGVSTVAGLFFQKLGRVPAAGDAIKLGNVELRVESMTGRSIDRVAVTVLAAQGGPR